MRQGRFRLFAVNLCIAGIYLAFLFVQLNLKYTSLITAAADTTSIYSNTHSYTKNYALNPVQERIASFLNLRINKRYLHQDFYQVFYLPNREAVDFSIAPKQQLKQVPVIQDPDLLPTFLRGPPSSMVIIC